MTTQLNQLTELTATSDDDLILIREDSTGIDKKMKAQNIRAKATTKDDVGLGNVDNVSADDLRDRSTHTGTQPMSTISDAGTAATADTADLVNRANHTGTQTLATISDAGTIASQNANAVSITGGNITADALTSGTVPSARIDGNYTGIDRTAAVFSHPTNTGSVTTTHLRAVMASDDSEASAVLSAVVASSDSEATSSRSAVVGSNLSTANAGVRNAAVVACDNSTASAVRSSAVLASEGSTASGTRSNAVVASDDSEATSSRSAVVASDNSKSSGSRSAVVAGDDSETNGDRSIVAASRSTLNNVATSMALGDGSGDPSTANRTIHLFASTGNIEIDGAVSTPVSDFAEYMANFTGSEIEAGILLTLENGAVRPADEGEDICGVVSHTAGFIGNDAPFHWQARYLRDEFGRQLFEDIPDPDWEAEIPDPDWDGEGEQPTIPNPEPQPTITVRKENPEWNPELPQVPRSDRPDEWTPVGLLGQVFVRTGEQVQAGDRITAKGGKGYSTTERTGLKVMQVTKDFDGDYGIARCLINVMV